MTSVEKKAPRVRERHRPAARSRRLKIKKREREKKKKTPKTLLSDCLKSCLFRTWRFPEKRPVKSRPFHATESSI
jgi:hypothetical protein